MLERWRGRISEGMQVRSSDGERLGKVVACQGGGFVVEKGFLFPRDLLVPYERVTDVRGGEIVLSLARADLAEAGPARAAAGTASPATEEASRAARVAREAAPSAAGEARAALGAELRAERGALDEFGKSREIRVSLVEEEVVASKRVEKVGEIHVRKDVVTEEKQITVPVTREVIRVERVAATQGTRPGEHVFEKESYDIPISEEHVTVEKRPVVREELRVGKEIQQGEETASTTVRRERADVETLGSVRRIGDGSQEAAPLRAAGGKR